MGEEQGTGTGKPPWLFLAIAMLAVGLPLLLYNGQAVLKQQREGVWLRVEAEIAHIHHNMARKPTLLERRGRRRGLSQRRDLVYPAIVTYTYEVDGQRYRNNMYNLNGKERVFRSPERRGRWVNQLERSNRLTVLHHPKDPSRSVMKYQPPMLPVALAMAGALLVMLSMPMFILHSQSRVSRDR